jgi:lantibiotic modifying enzyme
MFGERTLSTNVQHGAAGLLGVLVQATRLLDDPRARSSARSLAAWLDRMPAPSGGAVGLHFGHAGPAWALAEAGAVLDDGQLLDRAVERALEIPIDFPGPDICQGLSGLGLTLVRLCELSRDRRTRDRVAAIANALASWAERDEHGITWRTPATAPSTFAGRRYHGFAHGTAGVGTFLRSAAELLADDRLNQLSIECVSGLELGALHLPDGRVLWGSGPEEPSPGLPHWCNGSSGVATFLVRMHRDLPQASILDGAARAIMSDKWHCGMAYCHGLAGNADALLDLHDTLGGQYRAWAADLLQIMWDRRQLDGRGPGLSDELGHITPDFGVGYGGALSVLLRLRYGGPRLWLPEGLS